MPSFFDVRHVRRCTAACGSRLAVYGGCLDQSSLLSFSRNYVQCNELWVLDMATFRCAHVPYGSAVLYHHVLTQIE